MNAIGNILHKKGLLRRNTKNVMNTKPPIHTPQPLRRKPQPGPRSRPTIIHQKLSLLETDLRVMVRYALIRQFYMRVLRFPNSNSIIVF